MSTDKTKQFEIIQKDKIRIAALQSSLKEAWAQMRIVGTSASANAIKGHINLETLPTRSDRVIRIEPDGAGIAGVDIMVVGLAGKVAWDVWKFVLLPHIRDKWGDRALREKKTPSIGQKLKKSSSVKKTTKKPKKSDVR